MLFRSVSGIDHRAMYFVSPCAHWPQIFAVFVVLDHMKLSFLCEKWLSIRNFIWFKLMHSNINTVGWLQLWSVCVCVCVNERWKGRNGNS